MSKRYSYSTLGMTKHEEPAWTSSVLGSMKSWLASSMSNNSSLSEPSEDFAPLLEEKTEYAPKPPAQSFFRAATPRTMRRRNEGP